MSVPARSRGRPAQPRRSYSAASPAAPSAHEWTLSITIRTSARRGGRSGRLPRSKPGWRRRESRRPRRDRAPPRPPHGRVGPTRSGSARRNADGQETPVTRAVTRRRSSRPHLARHVQGGHAAGGGDLEQPGPSCPRPARHAGCAARGVSAPPSWRSSLAARSERPPGQAHRVGKLSLARRASRSSPGGVAETGQSVGVAPSTGGTGGPVKNRALALFRLRVSVCPRYRPQHTRGSGSLPFPGER